MDRERRSKSVRAEVEGGGLEGLERDRMAGRRMGGREAGGSWIRCRRMKW